MPATSAASIARVQANWNARCTMTATVRIRTGVNASGQPIYAAPIVYACFITQDIQQIRDTTGQLVTSIGRVAFAFPGPYGLVPHDSVTLPDGTSPLIAKVQRDNNTAGLQIQPVTCWMV
ncbi:MAG: hypothetical protein DLM70_00590 [Chloroflexi bacterium]|nr:MAG: hypothetical protein DLM70_00590 [Chloroflexota bacterium]